MIRVLGRATVRVRGLGALVRAHQPPRAERKAADTTQSEGSQNGPAPDRSRAHAPHPRSNQALLHGRYGLHRIRATSEGTYRTYHHVYGHPACEQSDDDVSPSASDPKRDARRAPDPARRSSREGRRSAAHRGPARLCPPPARADPRDRPGRAGEPSVVRRPRVGSRPASRSRPPQRGKWPSLSTSTRKVELKWRGRAWEEHSQPTRRRVGPDFGDRSFRAPHTACCVGRSEPRPSKSHSKFRPRRSIRCREAPDPCTILPHPPPPLTGESRPWPPARTR